LRRWPRLPSVHQQLCGLKEASNKRQRLLSAPWEVADQAHSARAPAIGSHQSKFRRKILAARGQAILARVSSVAAPGARRPARTVPLAGSFFDGDVVASEETRERIQGWFGWDAFAARKPSHSASNPVAPRSEREFAAVLLKFAPRFGPRVAQAPAEAMR
jgi:hypothetical protein